MTELKEYFQNYLVDLWETNALTREEINLCLTDNDMLFQLFLEFCHDYHLSLEKFAFEELTQFKDFLDKTL